MASVKSNRLCSRLFKVSTSIGAKTKLPIVKKKEIEISAKTFAIYVHSHLTREKIFNLNSKEISSELMIMLCIRI